MAETFESSGLGTEWYNWQAGKKAAEARNSTVEKPREYKSDLDKDAFLRLLITQLQYQDPLNPVEDKEFVGQMAQFSALEQMQNLNKTNTRSQAFSMIGRTVEGVQYNEEKGEYEEIVGQVQYVTTKNGETYLMIGKQELRVDNVRNVYTDYASYQLANLNNSVIASQNMDLIGKNIQALICDQKGKPVEFVEGVVEYVKFGTNGVPILIVGEKEIFPTEVTAVSKEPMLIGKKVNAYVSDGTELKYIEDGTVNGVKIVAEAAFLVVGNYEILIDKINYVTESLALVGKNITCEEASGKVDGVLIRNGVTYLQIGNKEVSYAKYRGIKPTTETESDGESEDDEE